MYLFELWDGTVLATSSSEQISYIEETYDVRVEWFCENIDRAIEQADYVIE